MLREDHRNTREVLGATGVLPPAINAKLQCGASLMAYGLLGAAHFNSDQKAEALAIYQEGLELWERQGDARGQAMALQNMGAVIVALGRPEEAEMYYLRVLAALEGLEDDRGYGTLYHNLAVIARGQRKITDGFGYLERSAPYLRRIGDQESLIHTLEEAGHLHDLAGDLERATRLFASAEQLRMELGAGLSPHDRQLLDEAIGRLRGQTNFDSWWAAGAPLTLDAALNLALEHGAPGAAAS